LKNQPIISIILPVRDEALYIEQGLHAIVSQNYPADYTEILVADGMSKDDTRRIIRKFAEQYPQFHIQIIDNPRQIVSTGMNLALRQAKGEIIIRVDGHCIIASDYIRNCVEHIQNESVDGVGGPMKSIGETYISAVIAIGMSSQFGVGNSAFRTLSGNSMLVDTVPFPAYTHQIIETVGPYDEELVRNQDDEYNYRIRKLGGKILLADDVRSTYFSRSSFKHLWKQYFQYGYWKVRVLQKHPRQMSPRQFVPPAFLLALLISALLSLSPATRFLSMIVPLLYLFANLMASLYTASKRGWKYLPLLPLAFAILHLSYGLGFQVGLVKFWNRWGDKVGKTPLWSGENT
jgi:glycosyltransferase involved in cell wall biosynthesis